MSCLQVMPRNRKKASLWKMVRSLFFGQKTISKVTNIRKKGLIKRRSTFEKPASSYSQPVIQRNAPARDSVSSSDDDTPRLPSEELTSQEFSTATNEQSEDISITTGSRVSHVITLAQIEIGPDLEDNDEDRQESNANSNLEESEEFYECNNNTLVDPSISPTSDSQETFSTTDFQTEEILELFETAVRIDKINSSRSINNLSGILNSPTSSPESNETEIRSVSEQVSVSAPCRRHGRSNSMAVGTNSKPEDQDRRKSFVEVSRMPPITLNYIPSGLQIEDRVVWVSETGPENGTVRWIGKIREQFYAGVELDKPVGNSSGIYGYGPGLFKRLFTCKLSYGRFIPVKELVLYTDYHDNGLKAGIICIICRDDFLETWEPCAESPGGSDAGKMVATKDCGHLFHAGCLSEWFSKKKYDHQPCPYCQHPMDRNDVIRIFPAQF